MKTKLAVGLNNVVLGYPPSLDPSKWVSSEIPYEEEQLEHMVARKVLPAKPDRYAWATWFRKCAGQRSEFSIEEAARTKPINPATLKIN